jgi:HEAT repeat protein
MNLCQLTLLVSLTIPAAPEKTPDSGLPLEVVADEQALKAANLPVAAPSLLDFFKKRVPSTENDAAVAPLIKQLTGKDPSVYGKAQAELVALGPAAMKSLEIVASNIEDLEAGQRAKQCKERIQGKTGAALVRSAARMLAALKPEGAAAVLIDYYPFADDDTVTHELDLALVQVARHEGKWEPALIKALEDDNGTRRAAAAVALCQAGGISVHERVRPLLKDSKPTVRFQVALALAGAHDAEALPIIIDLLTELPLAQRKQAEEFLTQLAGDWAIKTPQGNDATSGRLRRDLWLAWWKSVDGNALQDEFKSRTLSDEERHKVLGLLKSLKAESAEERDKATQELVALGPKVVPLLRQSLEQMDVRAGALAQRCLNLIEKGAANPLPDAAPRLMALRRPAGTLETFLAYLPFVDSEPAAVEIIDLIYAVGVREGKADPLLIKALEDKVAARRSAAAVVLCRTQSADYLPAVRHLLKDDDLDVRLRTAEALVAAGEREAVPVLIALLGELPLQQGYEVEDYLMRLTLDKAPEMAAMTADPASRTKARDAWAAWWKENGGAVELARGDLVQRSLGLTLVVENTGRVVELDRAGKVRWKVEGLGNPVDAQVLPGQRLLVAEQGGNRVTERDLAGKILWERNGINQPFVAQRQRDGNTFIGCRNFILEVDANGKQVYQINRPGEYLLAVTKFRDGTIGYINNQGRYLRIDNTGKEIKGYVIPSAQFGLSYMDILPNDNVIVFAHQLNKLVEYSPDGKTVWEAAVQTVGMPCRLANGHTLVPNINAIRITELDRTGKVVSELKDFGVRPYRVSRR